MTKGVKKVSLLLYFSSICRSLLLTTKAPAPSGIQRLTCAPANKVASACSQKKVIPSTLTANLFTWDAHVKGAIREDSVRVKLTPVI